MKPLDQPFDRYPADADGDETVIIPPDLMRQLQQRRAALLTGLLPADQQTRLSPEVTQLIEHRQQIQQQNTRALTAFLQSEKEYNSNYDNEEQNTRHNQAVFFAERTVGQTIEQGDQGLHAPRGTETAATRPVEQRQEAKTPPAPAQTPGFWQKILPRRIPVLYQMSMVECGAACLAMILNYYGRQTSVSEVRERCHVGRDGLSALDIVKAARNYGLRVRAVSVRENSLRQVTLPAIVHWEFNHFLIVERVSARAIDVVDPGLGRRRLTHEEFFNGFTGIAIMLEPGVHFDRKPGKARINLRRYAWSYIQTAPLSLLQVLGASLLLQLFGLILPVLTALIIDQIIPLRMKDTLLLLAVGLTILMVAQATTQLLRSTVLLYLQARIDTQMTLSFFEHLISLPQRFFQQRASGDILSRLHSNVVIRETISNQLISTVLDGSLVVTYLMILLLGSPLFGLIVLGIGMAQVLLLSLANRHMHRLSQHELLAQGKAQGYAAETLMGMTTLKAAGAEYRAFQRWTNLFFEQINASIRRGYVSSLLETATSSLRAIAPLALLLVGTWMVITNTLPAGTMLAMVSLATSILTPLGMLVSNGQQFQLVHSHLERIADVMEAEPEQDTRTAQEPPALSGTIRLTDVAFRYDPQSPLVLHDINISIRPGQKVAIVGRTGAGKSTLGNLLLGMYLPTQGEIYYDDLPLRTLNYQAVRAQFGVVTQSATVFSGSIRENITLNNPEMTMEDVIRVAKLAAIHDDILQMPMEYETFIAEGGSGLSGGQRQRLALARALANRPAILLLDEATSALDVLTEQTIEQNLHSLACTQIIIAHRLSTIRNADLILVLDQGRIVESGTHSELLRQNGAYAHLLQSQLASGEIRAE